MDGGSQPGRRPPHPGGPSILIWVASIKTSVQNPPPDPVVVVGDDLGRHSDSSGAQPLPQRTGRNVLNVDLRGVGNSKPSLNCPEVQGLATTLAGLRPSDPKTTTDFLGVVKECRARLVSQGWDLGAFNITEAAEDMEDFRQALGIGRWDLRALGYTSRVAFEEMRLFPDGIRAAWFDSPEYPQEDYLAEAAAGTKGALQTLTSVCDSNASLSASDGATSSRPETVPQSAFTCSRNSVHSCSVHPNR
jgi:pimeloyl-ACP methyl ester carboxylesterase